MKHILIPIDYSDVLTDQLRAAAELVDNEGGEITLLHVTAPKPEGILYSNRLGVNEVKNPDTLAKLTWCESAVQASTSGQLPIHLHLENGSPAKIIDRISRDHGCDGIVIGSHGHGKLFHLLHGAVTSGVLHSVDVPVFVVPSTAGATEQKLPVANSYVVAVDFSHEAEKLLQVSVVQAKKTDAEVYMVHAYSPAHSDGRNSANALKHLKELAERACEAHDYTPAHIHSFVEKGAPAEVILKYAKRLHPKAIVIGSHGHGKLYDMVLGSQAQKVAAKAPCPVLVHPFRKGTGDQPAPTLPTSIIP